MKFTIPIEPRTKKNGMQPRLCGNWRESRGCNMEYGYAKAKGIPIKFITG